MNIKNLKVEQLNGVKNQLVITTPEGRYFQSYDSLICFIPNDGPIQLDTRFWKYSNTTSRHRAAFLGETTERTQEKINAGVYQLTNLN